MDTVSEELSQEQKYFDVAWEHRERMRTALGQAPEAAANSGAAARIRKDAQDRLGRLGGADDPVAFGRMDDEEGERFYLGNHAIFDDESELLVVNWQAPAAARYYQANHTDPHGLILKRTYECSMNEITSFNDIVFAQLAADVAELESPSAEPAAPAEIGDTLLADLNRNRTGTMQDIVQTIQAAQYELIRAPLDQITIIQGGPGTGKTAIALHRVSWLIANSQLSAQDVLIIGPNPTFTRYTRTVLPSLGDTNVIQLDINQLHPPVKRGRREEPDVVKLKGDRRLAGLVQRALHARVGLPESQQRIKVRVEGRPVTVTADEVTPLLTRAQGSTGTYAVRRQLFRELLIELFSAQLPVGRAQLRAALDPVMDRLWPSVTAAAFLRELYGSRDRLMAAAGDEFTAREVSQLHRRPADRLSEETWSDADLAVLDEADHLINGVEARYPHIVVDEAQDLSPMQIRAVARRSSIGSMTVVGDIAQSTGPWARDDWNELLDDLPGDLAPVLEELRYGYRVPRQIFELAAQLLPIAAPDVTAPQVVRDGPTEPAIHRLVDGDERATEAVRVAMEHASYGRSVAIISPASHRHEVVHELDARDVSWRSAAAGELGPGINLVSPQEAKGLEFDAVVVVEPEEIVTEDARGHRLLYVALTRTTRYLDIVCVGHPLGLNPPTEDRSAESSDESPATEPSDEAEAATPVPPGPDPISGEEEVVELDAEESAELLAEPAGDPEGAGTDRERPTSSAAHRYQHVIDAGVQEVIALLHDTIAPKLWRAVLAEAIEVIDPKQ